MLHVRSPLACALALVIASSAAFLSAHAANVDPPSADQDLLQHRSGLPYIRQLYIHSGGDVTGPVCASDSVRVSVIGALPTPCWTLSRIELIPPPFGSPLPWPPTVRFVFDDRACLGVACPEVLQPFTAQAVLPPMPFGKYRLRVETQHVSCDSAVTDSIPSQAFPLSVDTCESPAPCLLGDWVHPGNDLGCDARITKTAPAQVTFTIAPQVALAGLQGRFGVSSEALQIVGIEPIGPARGMHLEWTREPGGGARFVLFDPNGAPIPPAVADSTDSIPPRPAYPILRLTVQQSALRIQLPPLTTVHAYDLLGSDIDGGGVRECPILTVRFAAVLARICSGSDCDFNRDGRADIRDLVRMAHCSLRDSLATPTTPPCPDSLSFPDCDRDGHKSLADVICCAIHILRDRNCPDCPEDTTGLRDPSVRVVMGTPVVEGGQVRIPVTVENAERLGGALIALRYPAARYTASLELPASRNWLQLQDIADGVATIGLVRLDGSALREDVAGRAFELRLQLEPGQRHGGDVQVADVQFSSSEGTAIEGGDVPSATPLGGHAVVELSEARPNPFTGEMRFSVTLAERGEAAIGVFDLAGRRVALLHHGVLDAGTHDFAWRGARDDGTPAATGVYFYRATLAGHTASRRVVRLGN